MYSKYQCKKIVKIKCDLNTVFSHAMEEVLTSLNQKSIIIVFHTSKQPIYKSS